MQARQELGRPRFAQFARRDGDMKARNGLPALLQRVRQRLLKRFRETRRNVGGNITP